MRQEFVDYKNSSSLALTTAEKKLKSMSDRVKEGREIMSENEEKEVARVQVLEESKASLNEELQGIKTSLYNILGDLYDANLKARESIKGGGVALAGGGSDNTASDFSLGLDQASVDKVRGMLDLTPDEVADIFSAEEQSEIGGGRGGEWGNLNDKADFLNRVNQALGGGGGGGATGTGTSTVEDIAQSIIANNLELIASPGGSGGGSGGGGGGGRATNKPKNNREDRNDNKKDEIAGEQEDEMIARGMAKIAEGLRASMRQGKHEGGK